jgi:hypothetical protein
MSTTISARAVFHVGATQLIETLTTGRPAVGSRTMGASGLLQERFKRFGEEPVEPGDARIGPCKPRRLAAPRVQPRRLCRDQVRVRFSLDHVVQGVKRSHQCGYRPRLRRRHG